jgi:dCMP deaminase
MAEIFSTCAKKKYCAVLVDKLGHIVGVGYNGGPSGYAHCDEGGCPRYLEDSPSGSNYDNCIAIHAEANALIHSDYSSRAIDIYVNGPPCFSCAKLISNSTIKNLYYVKDEHYSNWENVRSFLSQCGINLVEVV